MFTMMNLERLSIGIQGIGLAETAYQTSRNYALERKQGRNSLGQSVNIIEHADVRRMLLKQRAYTEPARALAVFMGTLIDQQYHHPDKLKREYAKDLMALLTPIAKAFFTDKGYESCNLGLQVLGGHGYVREWGLEQLVRDAKIAQIYEGTNGIQAQDLLIRKVCLDKKSLLSKLYQLIDEELSVVSHCDEAIQLNHALQQAMTTFKETSDWLKANFANQPDAIQGGAVDYLNASGHIVYAWLWLKMLNAIEPSLDSAFYERKKLAAHYFTEHLLVSVKFDCESVKSGYEDYMSANTQLI
jgi:hypothetical protein